MTNTELLAAYKLVCGLRQKLPSGNVVRGQQRKRDYAVAYLDRDPFEIVLQVSIGPRGGIGGHACFPDRRITPAADAIHVAAINDTSRDAICPLHRLCWSDDGNTQMRPSAAQLADFLAGKISALNVTPESRRKDVVIPADFKN